MLNLIDEEITKIYHFCQLAEIGFHRFAGPRNVSVNLKCEVLSFVSVCVGCTHLSREK